jgi:flagellar hook assembly protein FlgD
MRNLIMKTKYLCFSFIIPLTFILSLLAEPVFAQSSKIPRSAFIAGFGASASRSTSVTSVAGQTFVGTSTNGSSATASGFLVNPSLTFPVTVVSDKHTDNRLPAVSELDQNYPNPFNPTTRIHFALSRMSEVHLAVYDVLGHRVVALLDAVRPAGYHSVEWNGRDAFGKPVNSGTYFYRLEAGEFKQTRKLLLLK